MQNDRFLTLFLKHERSLAAFARSILPDWEAVDDVIQNASLAMWRKIDSLREDEEFVRWAIVFVRMEALKYRRTKARDRLVLSDQLIDQIANESQQENPEDLSEHSVALSNCLQSFSKDHQQLLLSPYVAHGKVKEIAVSVGCSANALYKKIGRLRVKLLDCIESKLQLDQGAAG